jgi:hypothetical protein
VAYRIVSNNEKVLRALPDQFDATAIAGLPFDVYEATERLLQEGWRLVTAPLPPNVPLIRSPYRSLIIEKSTRRYDVSGILMIEKAKEKLAVLGTVDRPEGREDFASIDLELLNRAMSQL